MHCPDDSFVRRVSENKRQLIRECELGEEKEQQQ
jgi:hypothetical protein